MVSLVLDAKQIMQETCTGMIRHVSVLPQCGSRHYITTPGRIINVIVNYLSEALFAG